MKNAFYLISNALLFLQTFKFLKFFSLPKALWFQEKVENEIIMTSWNGLHKLPNVISGKIRDPLSVFELRCELWSCYGPQTKKNFWTYLAAGKGAGN